MKTFLYLISVFWLTIGTFALLTPLKLKTFYSKLIKPVKPLFILPLLAAWLFFWAHPASSLQGFIKFLGILSLIKGLFILFFPVTLLKSTLNYFLGRSNRWWRHAPYLSVANGTGVYGACPVLNEVRYGVFIILLGVVVIWSVL